MLLPSARLERRNYEVLARIDDLFVEHDEVQMAMSAIGRLYAWSETVRNSRDLSLRPKCLLLTGPSRSGKSRLLGKCAELLSVGGEHGKPTQRILIAQIHEGMLGGGITELLLHALGDPAPRAGSKQERWTRLIGLLERLNVHLVILDELNHLTDRLSKHIAYVASDNIKQLINQSRTCFVLAGLPSAEEILVANPQLNGRTMAKVQLHAFEWDDDGQTFKRLLRRFDQALPFPNRAGLDRHDVAIRIHATTGGLIGGVANLLHGACAYALDRNAERLSVEYLHHAAFYQRPLDQPNWVNPFDLDELNENALTGAPTEPDRVTRLRGKAKRKAFEVIA